MWGRDLVDGSGTRMNVGKPVRGNSDSVYPKGDNGLMSL